MASRDSELLVYRFLSRLRARLRGARDADQALRAALRATADFFQAASGCLAVLPGMEARARIGFFLGVESEWDVDLITRFLRGERPRIPEDLLLVPIHRRQRLWGALVLRTRGVVFTPGEHKDLLAVAETISERVQQADRERILEVRSLIDRKIMAEIRPKDLFYQILHGLRTLTGYDHSAALLIAEEGVEELEVVSEQIAWRKGKSARIGLRLRVVPQVANTIEAGEVYGFDRHGTGWSQWSGPEAALLSELMDYNTEAAVPQELREGGMLCGTLSTRDGALAVLKIASRAPGELGPYEADLVRSFLPQVSVALQNSRRAETLQARMLDAERKHAMANLARSVAHDVNNALGSILPLVQQIRDEARAGRIDPKVLSDDMATIERSFQACRRIFGGMLAFARGVEHGVGDVDVGRAIDAALVILEDGLERRRVRCERSIPHDLPVVPGRQADLERVFFNLLGNASDAMPHGGELRLRALAVDGNVEVLIEDTGSGISQEHLPLIQEPFFTTKPHGTGLGLTICRSILWEMRGELHIESTEGRGTQVRVVLPMAAAETAASSSSPSPSPSPLPSPPRTES